MTDILILLGSTAAGVLVGLLPGMPIWLAVFAVFPFADSLSTLQIIIYWLGVAIGSQFFGSVSTLLLRIPGENSSLIYLKDTYNLSLQERLDLVRQTAWGSAIATLIGIFVVAVLYSISSQESILWWTSTYVKFFLYSLLMVLLVAASPTKIWAIILLAFGVIFADKTNQSLPDWMLQVNYAISNLTIFSATLALIVVPEFLTFNRYNLKTENFNISYSNEPIKWKTIFSGSIVGCASGLIPGATATIGSMSAYKMFSGSTTDKIVAAESANNSAIITALLPLIILGIPTTVDSIIVGNILNMKLFVLPQVFADQQFYGLTLGWATILIGLFFSLVFFFTSQRFLKFYIKLVELLHTKLAIFYIGIISALIYIDVTTNAINISAYAGMLVILSAIGYWFKKRDINPLPFLMGLLLGDSITWSIYYIVSIYT